MLTLWTIVIMSFWTVAAFLYFEKNMAFEALNTLFTGLALIGVLITIRSQNESSKIQNFESILFKTIDYQKELLKDLPITLNNKYFKSFTELLDTEIDKKRGGLNDRELFESNYDQCYYKFLDGLDPYFKSLDVILELIEKSELKEEQKDFYFKLVNTFQSYEQKITLQYHSTLYVQGTASRRLKRMLYKGEFICLNGEHSEIFNDADNYFEEERRPKD